MEINLYTSNRAKRGIEEMRTGIAIKGIIVRTRLTYRTAHA